MTGWIKYHRKIMDNGIYSNPYLLKLWSHCLLKATHTPHTQIVGNQSVDLEPGQFITGRDALAAEFNKGATKQHIVSAITLWRWLNNFEKWGMLNIKKTTKYSVVSITNWSEHQQGEQQMNNKRTTDEQQMNTNKNVKKEKNDNKETIPYAAIIKHLNEMAGKSFKPSTAAHKKLIEARWNEGHRLEDFIKVIDVCSANWKGVTFKNGESGDKYLQPSTLFNGKFDERLNWTNKKTKTEPIYKSNSIDASEYLKELNS